MWGIFTFGGYMAIDNLAAASIKPSAIITTPAAVSAQDKSISEETVPVKRPKKDNTLAVSQNDEKLEQKLLETADALQTHFDVNNKKLNFSVHRESERMIVKVIDPESGETLQELPSEAVLKMVANIEKFTDNISSSSGMLFDEIV